MWLPACWAFPSTVSTPADVLVLDPVARPARMGARITSICPSVRPSVRTWDVRMCGWHACIVNHWRSMTSAWNIGPTAHSVSLSLSPYCVGVVSPFSTPMHFTYARACVCVRYISRCRHTTCTRRCRCERASASGAAAINTNWCICARGFRARPFAWSARADRVDLWS